MLAFLFYSITDIRMCKIDPIIHHSAANETEIDGKLLSMLGRACGAEATLPNKLYFRQYRRISDIIHALL